MGGNFTVILHYIIQRFVDLLEVRQLVHPDPRCVLINLFWMGGYRHFKEFPYGILRILN